MHANKNFVLGSYLVQPDQKLGKGSGCEQVLKGIHLKTGGAVAIKVMRKEHFPVHEVQLFKEAQEVPGVNKLKDCFQNEAGTVFLAMEHLPCNLLDLLIERFEGGQNFSEEQARRIFGQVANTVQALHIKKIAHRDIKLENIMIDPATGRTALIDFGLACRFEQDLRQQTIRQHVGAVLGSPGYHAPEIAVRPGRGVDVTKCDVYSLGVLLYVLLCGRFPFDDKNDHSYYLNEDRKSRCCCSGLVEDDCESEEVIKKSPNFYGQIEIPAPAMPSSGLNEDTSNLRSKPDLRAKIQKFVTSRLGRSLPKLCHVSIDASEALEGTSLRKCASCDDASQKLSIQTLQPKRIPDRKHRQRKSLSFDQLRSADGSNFKNDKKLSLEVQDLLHFMLAIDDTKRACLDEVSRHPWMCGGR